MKKLSLTLAALALVLGMSQCKKQEEPVQNGEKQHIVLNASFAESNSKIAEDGIGCLKWSVGDIIIVKQSETELGELECTDAEDGIFEGDITSTTGNITFTFGEEKYMEQTGELNAAMHLTSPEVEYKADGNYGSVLMSISNAVLKLDVSALGTTGEMTIAANGATVASVTDVASSEGKAVFVAVPTDETEKAYTITCGGKTATKTWTLEKNVFYTKAGAEGAGTGEAIVIDTPKFSVSATTTVEFAPGNLYWDGSAFHFEDNQWSFKKWDASHVSHFFWSKTASVAYASSYSDSGASTSDVFFTNGTQTTANPDFHVNGETGTNTWRTLSKAEWNYLLNTRTSASSLRKWKDFGSNVKGLVILPDGTNASVMSSISSTSDLATYNAVFLPAAGRREGTTMDKVGLEGFYWPSTPNVDNRAYGVYFSSYGAETNPSDRYYGYAVRLVQRFPKPAPEVEYVEVAGLMWAKDNLAVTDWGKAEWYDTGTCRGDYFRPGDIAPIYSDYNNGFVWINADVAKFGVTTMTANPQYDDYGNLTPECDAARQILGGSWRLPTSEEFQRLINNTYVVATLNQYYVFRPDAEHTAGVLASTLGDLDPDDAILVFPHSGQATGTTIEWGTLFTHYYTANKYPSLTTDQATIMNMSYLASNYLYVGCPMRAVRDIKPSERKSVKIGGKILGDH